MDHYGQNEHNRLQQISTLMQRMNGDFESFRQEIDKTSGLVLKVRELSKEIDFLALNAAIEAAHAGDSGAGFSVIAMEMRQLSIKTQTVLAEVEESAKRMMMGMQAIAERRSEIVNQVKE